MDDLRKICDQTLIAQLPPRLKDAIDVALAHGARRKDILARCRRMAGGKRTLVILAVEAYLGADQHGKV